MMTELPVDKQQLQADVKSLTGISPPRNYQNIQSLNLAADVIFERLQQLGYKPEWQSFEVYQHAYKNILVSYGPEQAPRFIVGAHYDVAGNQPGADDNGSGVAALLALADLLKRLQPDLKFRIDLAAYALEEPPFFRTNNMGSHVHAKSLHAQGVDVIGMISLEMLGYFTDEPDSQQYPLPLMGLFYPSTGNFIAVVGNFKSSGLVSHFKKHMKVADIGVESLSAPVFVAGVDFSDHYNFWKYGYQAAMITDTAFYRNKHYHHVSDTIETLDFDKMAEVVKGLYWALINLK